jgi:hypothetical protein
MIAEINFNAQKSTKANAADTKTRETTTTTV